MNTHNIVFHRQIRKILCEWTLLFEAMGQHTFLFDIAHFVCHRSEIIFCFVFQVYSEIAIIFPPV